MSDVRLTRCRRRELTRAHLAEIAAYATGCNRDPRRHIGYVGQTPQEVAGELADLDGEALFAVARDGDRMCGLLAAEWDLDVGRTWLHGPWADPADLMDRLYRTVLPHLPAAAGEHELFLDTANTAVAGFAARHGFAPHGHQAILRFRRDRLAGLPAASLPRLIPRWHEQLAALHDRAFPGTYAPARTLLADPPPILVATDGDTLLGYVVLRLRPDQADAQVEYLAVVESARRTGVGTRLLTAALHEAFGDHRYGAVDLVVDDPAAGRLYERVGFTLRREMRSFRRPPAAGVDAAGQVPAAGGVDAAGQVIAAHERRLATLDPWLPASHPLPAPAGDDVLLHTDGAVGLARRDTPDPESLSATWRAAVAYRLLPRVGGPDPTAAMARLLRRWHGEVAAHLTAGDADTEAGLSWPSRDTAMTRLFLAHGLVPAAVIAARPAGRACPPAPDGLTVRPLRPADVDAAVDLYAELVRWDAQFGTVTERPSTAAALRTELVTEAGRDPSWVWVCERSGQLAGLLVVSPPERADWIAPLTSRSPVAYLGSLVVTAGRRGHGVGTALVRHAHAALDAAGVDVTLLHYNSLNPLSAPFWHRCGYRPLWTSWHAFPAARLGPER